MSKTLDIRRLKSNQPKTVAANKDRLQAFSSALDKEFEADLLGPLSSASAPPKQEIWRNAIVCCGSNAFNQLNIDEADIMSVNLKACPLIGADNESGASGGRLGGGGLGTGSGYGQSRKSKGKIEACESAKKKEHNGSSITCVSSGGNLSAVVQDGECYIWGEGLGPHSLRVPTAIPHITNVVQVSCGKKHCGVVTAAGEAYTWGSNESGMLGHGYKSKEPVSSPLVVNALVGLFTSSLSCGAFHTAFIACEAADVVHTPIPNREYDDVLTSGSLYTCGLGKAGQLGLGADSEGQITKFVCTPTKVTAMEEQGLRAVRVSCGLHHTLIVGTPMFNVRTFSTSVLSCGWGEHGRLGLNHELEVHTPTIINFPMPFHATEVGAGEQHSLASGRQGCYAWGNNSMGQLGVGSPASTEFCITPVKIPVPEGMELRKLAAGGRHSAGITACGKVLSWGWGEEGQLGHGTERNANLPRPCRVPKVQGKQGSPVAIALGTSHTTVLLQNTGYSTPMPSPVKEKAPPPLPAPSPVRVIERPRSPSPESEPEPEPEPIVEKKVTPPPSPRPETPPKAPVVGIKELLLQREEIQASPEPVEEEEEEEEEEEVVVEEPEEEVVALVVEESVEEEEVEPEPLPTLTVTFSPNENTHADRVEVMLSCDISGLSGAKAETETDTDRVVSNKVVFLYTTNGTEPNELSSQTNGSSPVILDSVGITSLSVVAQHPDYPDRSAVFTKMYTITRLSPPLVEPEPEPEAKKEGPKFGIFYGKEGQDTSGLLIANSAIRAEARKRVKEDKAEKERKEKEQEKEKKKKARDKLLINRK